MIKFAFYRRDVLDGRQGGWQLNLWVMTYIIMEYIGASSAMRLNVRMNLPLSCRAFFLKAEETVRAAKSFRSKRRGHPRPM